MGLSSAFARANASSPHGYQSTGLCACCSRYGLVSRARRLSPTPASARQRQVADRRRQRAAIRPHFHTRAGRVLAANEGQRDGPTETQRERGAGHPADDGAVGHDVGAGWRHDVAVEEQAAQVAVHVAAVADPHDHLLAGITALGVRDEALGRNLREQHGRVDVGPEARRAGLDAQRLERRGAERPRAGADRGAPRAVTLTGRHHEPDFARLELPAAADDARVHAVERGADVRPRGVGGHGAGQTLHGLLRRGTDQHQQRAPAAGVLERDLLGEQIVIERGHGGFPHAGRGQQEHPIVEGEGDERDLHLAVHVEQRRGAALPGRQRGHVVAQERVQELRAIAAGHLDDAEVGAIHEADGVAGGAVLGARIAVRERRRCAHALILHERVLRTLGAVPRLAAMPLAPARRYRVTDPVSVSALALLAASACATGGVTTAAGPEGPAQAAYAPKSGRGPIVIVLSGQSGPGLYHGYAAELAGVGYYAVLLDGKDVLTGEQDGLANLRKAIERAQRAPQALAGKAAVVEI